MALDERLDLLVYISRYVFNFLYMLTIYAVYILYVSYIFIYMYSCGKNRRTLNFFPAFIFYRCLGKMMIFNSVNY